MSDADFLAIHAMYCDECLAAGVEPLPQEVIADVVLALALQPAPSS